MLPQDPFILLSLVNTRLRDGDLALNELEKMGVTEFFDVSANGAVKKFSRVNKSKCKIYTLEEL